MTVVSESARLAMIRRRLAAISPGMWMRAHDVHGCFVQARDPMGELSPVLRFDGRATDDEIDLVVDLPETLSFLLSLIDRAIAKHRRAGEAGSAAPPQQRQRDPKDYAAECAMKCAEPAFRVFLEEKHGLERPLTDDRVAQRVRGLLGVRSRRELNDSDRAGAAWRQLRGEYGAWRRAGR